jgi:hypothetical protein
MCATTLTLAIDQLSATSEPAAAEVAAPLFACILVTPYGVPAAERLALAEALRLRCERLTDQIAWLGQHDQTWPDGALLDLGRRSASDAQVDCEQLMAWFVAQQLTARIGIGSSQTLAQLAALRAASGVMRVVDPEQAHSFLQRFPLDALSGLAAEAITPALVVRLSQDGLRTLGEVARLDSRDPLALRRQYGDEVGVQLALIAQGDDQRPRHTRQSVESGLRREPPEYADAARQGRK